MRDENQRCGQCDHYYPDSVQCRRYPKWRRKYMDDWCGEWQPQGNAIVVNFPLPAGEVLREQDC